MFSAMIVEPADLQESQPAGTGRHLDIGKGYERSGNESSGVMAFRA